MKKKYKLKKLKVKRCNVLPNIVEPSTHSIEESFGCCKRDHEPPMSVREMDEAIEKAVSEKL